MEKHFAALNLLDLDSENKLTKSCSYSSLPTSQQFYLKQSYQSEGPPGLTRQYSCEQIFAKTVNSRQIKISETIQNDKKEYRREWQTTLPYSDSFQLTNWQFCKSNNVMQTTEFKKENAQNEIEYMEIEDVDCSRKEPTFSSCFLPTNSDVQPEKKLLHSEPKQMEKVNVEEKESNAITKDNKNTYENIKKKLRPLVPKKNSPIKRKTSMCYYNCACLFLLSIAVVIIALFLDPSTPVCSQSIFFTKATDELQQKLYGQQEAISNIINFLNQDFSFLKVMCIIGGTGVGKSYTAEILKRNYISNKVIVYDLLFDQNINSNIGKSLQSPTLIIIENLKMKDLDTFSNTLEVLKEHKEKCITVLAIFNVENIDDHLVRDINVVESKKVMDKLVMEKHIDALVVPYMVLNEEALTMCIAEAASLSNLKLTDIQMNEVKQMLISSGSGCKGAYAKVQVVGRQ